MATKEEIREYCIHLVQRQKEIDDYVKINGGTHGIECNGCAFSEILNNFDWHTSQEEHDLFDLSLKMGWEKIRQIAGPVKLIARGSN